MEKEHLIKYLTKKWKRKLAFFENSQKILDNLKSGTRHNFKAEITQVSEFIKDLKKLK